MLLQEAGYCHPEQHRSVHHGNTLVNTGLPESMHMDAMVVTQHTASHMDCCITSAWQRRANKRGVAGYEPSPHP